MSNLKTKSGVSLQDGSRKPQIGAKEAISTFCKFLHFHGALQLSPEVLRQAKFDRQDAVVPMWTLLNQLTHFILQEKFLKHDASSLLTTNPDEAVDNIKQIMWYQGYRCQEFFTLPWNMDRGSQELLLATGWLITKTGLMRHFVKSCQVPFLGGDTTYLHVQNLCSERYKTVKPRCDESISISGKIKSLAWIIGRCKMAMRSLHMKQQEYCNLTHQIYKATQGAAISFNYQHLSVLETFLLRYPQHMKKYQDMLHAEVLRLQVCVKWKEQEHIFWQWMESVLDAKLSKPQEEIFEDDMVTFIQTCNSAFVMEIRLKLQKVLKELSDVISQVQGCLKDLPDDQWEQISEDTEIIKRAIISDVEEEIASLRPPVGNRHAQTQPIRLQYIPDKGAKTNKNTMQVGSVCITDEIDRLQSVAHELELQHRQQRDRLRQEMDALSERLDGVVCIPPIGK